MDSITELNKEIHKVISGFADMYESWEQHDPVVYRCLFAIETKLLQTRNIEKAIYIDMAYTDSYFYTTPSLAEIFMTAIEADPIYFKRVFKGRYKLYLIFQYLSAEKKYYGDNVENQLLLFNMFMMVQSILWNLDYTGRVKFMQDYKMEYVKFIGYSIAEFILDMDEIDSILIWDERLDTLILKDKTLLDVFSMLRESADLLRADLREELYNSIKSIDLQSILPSRKPSLVERLKDFARTVVCYVWALK